MEDQGSRPARAFRVVVLLGAMLAVISVSATWTATGTAQARQSDPSSGVQATVAEATSPGRVLAEVALNGLRDSVVNLLASGVKRGDFASGVALVAVRGQIVAEEAYGNAVAYTSAATPLDRPIPARRDTIYDLASLTKLFTVTAAMQLVEQGRLNLDVPIWSYVPALAGTFAGGSTARQLLTHTAGFPPGFRNELSEAGGDAVRALGLVIGQGSRGERRVYSDLSMIALGKVIEGISGEQLDAYVANHIVEPLRLSTTRYLPPPEWRERIAATEAFEDRHGPQAEVAWGEVHDPTAWRLGGVSGHAGLFSSASDLARFGQAILNGGQLDGVRILRPETVALMTSPQTRAVGDPNGLGWELGQSWYMGRLAEPRGEGHTGFTGTSLVLDARRNVVVVLLTNRVHPTPHGGSLAAYRQGLADLAARFADQDRPLLDQTRALQNDVWIPEAF